MANANNKNLKTSRTNADDEFYTKLSDIEKELGHYHSHFKDKVVLCNCDDPEASNFWKYFKLNFSHLGIKKLISTHYEKKLPSYKLEYFPDSNNKLVTTKTMLEGNGDFRSPECRSLLSEVDIVVTNPPFSLFREYIAQLIEHDKKFLVIGSQNAISYVEIFPFIKDNLLWLGHTHPKDFTKPNGDTQSFGNISWFTNLPTKKRTENIILYKTFTGNESKYPKYVNYEAINVDLVEDIPSDFTGFIGVPITFITQYNPSQFEIIGLGNGNNFPYTNSKRMECLDNLGKPTTKFVVNAKQTLYYEAPQNTKKTARFKDAENGKLYISPYARVIIKRK